MNFAPLHSTAINSKYTHTLYGILCAKNKMALSIIPLPLAHFVFLFLLFQARALDHHHGYHHHHHDLHHLLHHLECATLSHDHLE